MKTIKYKITSLLGKSVIYFLEKLISGFVKKEIYISTDQFKWIDVLESNYSQIKHEFDEFYKKHTGLIPDICEISEEQNQVVNKNEWKFIPLYAYGIPVTSYLPFFPVTAKCLQSIPDYTTVFFSILMPKTKIKSHRGAYKGFLRYHLGIRIPENNKICGINISNEVYHWENGKSVVFDDTFEHFAWNDSNEYRTVLYIDFIRPMPAFLMWISKKMTKVISKSLFIQNAVKNLNNFEQDKNLVKILG